jgi:hypothetical protein
VHVVRLLFGLQGGNYEDEHKRRNPRKTMIHHLLIFWEGFWRVTLVLGFLGSAFLTGVVFVTWKDEKVRPPKGMKIFAVVFTVAVFCGFCYFVGASWR